MLTDLIGQILLKNTSLTEDQLNRALQIQSDPQNPKQRIGQILLEQSLINPQQLAAAIAQQWNLPCLEQLKKEHLAPHLVQKFPLEFLKTQRVLPIKIENNQTAVALIDPLNLEPYDAVLTTLRQHCPRVITTPDQIDQAISQCYYQNLDNPQDPSAPDQITQDAALLHTDIPENPLPEDLLSIANKAPVINLVNNIFFKAVNCRASDIHIEPYQDHIKVRYRIDGVLQDAASPPKHLLAAIVSRIKIMANLNIAERRLPQDGQSRIKIASTEMDIRCSVIPTAAGERVVLRLLDKGRCDINLDSIGFTPAIKEQFTQLIHRPHGIILITGPTGSGKTTTLYAALNELNDHKSNILTVEDPIEYQLDSIGQMQVKPKIGLTFAHCLRHILRQDPDIIMIGEIRDEETARIAIQSALTGHLVLSTLHTNDSASAFTRLLDMKIESYLVASAVIAVMAQRLVRSICPHCKVVASDQSLLSQTWQLKDHAGLFEGQFYKGKGCEHCLNTGYLGRTGLFELLVPNDRLKQLVTNRAPADLIKDIALESGTVTLREDGLFKAIAAQTTLDEVFRVTQENLTPLETLNTKIQKEHANS